MAEKILIVDDDIETLRLVGLMLQRQGFQILAANNGTQALVMARKDKPDLIVLDIMMPDMDGFQVTRELRQNPDTAHTPILMFTAKSMVDDKVAGYEIGADDYLTKPVHPAELVAHIKALLARSKTRGPAPAPAAPINKGYVIGVVAPRGGLGVSSLTLNLALSYNQKYKADIITAEMRPGQGTWAMELGLPLPEGLNNLLQLKPSEITPSAVESELFRTTFGIRMLLASPRQKDAALLANTAQLEAVVNTLPGLAALTLLDIGTPCGQTFEKLISACHEVIVVTEPNPNTIARTKLFLSELIDLGVGKSKIMTLAMINRVRADVQLSIIQVQEMLGGQTVSILIPPVPEQAYHAALKFVPYSLLQPDGLLAQQFVRLAEQIHERVKK